MLKSCKTRKAEQLLEEAYLLIELQAAQILELDSKVLSPTKTEFFAEGFYGIWSEPGSPFTLEL